MPETDFLIEIKQGVDLSFPIYCEDENQSPLAANLQTTDVCRLQIRDAFTNKPVYTCTAANFVVTAGSAGTEHITVTIPGEHSETWKLSWADALGATSDGEVVPPRVKLYGTLLIDDGSGNSRILSGLDLQFILEGSFTRPEVPSA